MRDRRNIKAVIMTSLCYKIKDLSLIIILQEEVKEEVEIL